MPKFHVMDLFCGTGGFSHGIESHSSRNFEIIFGIDKNKTVIDTFEQNHPDAEAICDDIKSWPPNQVSRELSIEPCDVDIIVGGPPCQGFSSIRPNRGSEVEDRRNGLYTNFVEYINFYKPEYFVMENVVGLSTHDGGDTIERTMSRLNASGYKADWRIVNAATFGLPQRRERLIIMGAANEEIEFPTPTHRTEARTIGHKDKSRLVTTKPTLSDFQSVNSLSKARNIMAAISDLPSVVAGEEKTDYELPPQTEYQELMRKGSKKITLHKATNHGEKMLKIIRHSGSNKSSIPDHLIDSGYSSSYSRLDADVPSVTLTVNFIHPASNKCIHPYQDRALTPREGARIQSFPDTFEFAGNRTEIVDQIGNAVPPLLGRILAENILSMNMESHQADFEKCVTAH